MIKMKIYPGAEEVCDEVDNNCDGITDDDAVEGQNTYYTDSDDDGYGDANAPSLLLYQKMPLRTQTTATTSIRLSIRIPFGILTPMVTYMETHPSQPRLVSNPSAMFLIILIVMISILS